MFEKVLVPLDGSKVGEAALPVIRQLADKLCPEAKVEVTLIGVITLLRHWVVVGEASAPVSYTEEELNLIKSRVTEYLEKTAEVIKGENVTVKTIVVSGNAAEEIIKAAERIKSDLIAMSTHGLSGLTRWVFGSVTEKIVVYGATPVLVVHPPGG